MVRNIRGIDISMHNGAIDFDAVRNSGIEIVIIKATEGVEYIDPLFEQHYNGSRGKGLKVGFYHYMSEKTDPAQQAQDFFNAINGKEHGVTPVLDIEDNKRCRSSVEVSDRCLTFLNKFKELSGVDCIIYTGGFFGRDVLDSRLKSYKGWIAHYYVAEPMDTGFQAVGHQSTDKGTCPGITGNVDLNTFGEGMLSAAYVDVSYAPVTPAPVAAPNEYVENGTAVVCVSKLNVRTAASTSAEIVASYGEGESFVYNYVVIAEGYVWVRYTGASSGQHRYVAVKNQGENKRYANCY